LRDRNRHGGQNRDHRADDRELDDGEAGLASRAHGYFVTSTEAEEVPPGASSKVRADRPGATARRVMCATAFVPPSGIPSGRSSATLPGSMRVSAADGSSSTGSTPTTETTAGSNRTASADGGSESPVARTESVMVSPAFIDTEGGSMSKTGTVDADATVI